MTQYITTCPKCEHGHLRLVSCSVRTNIPIGIDGFSFDEAIDFCDTSDEVVSCNVCDHEFDGLPIGIWIVEYKIDREEPDPYWASCIYKATASESGHTFEDERFWPAGNVSNEQIREYMEGYIERIDGIYVDDVNEEY